MSYFASINSWKDFDQSLAMLGNVDKGRAFEELTKMYLLTDPTFSTKITNLWHHSELPQSVIDELDLLQPEVGVDLIAQVTDGSYWAIQCKFHQDRTSNVSYTELSTFFSITERPQTYGKLSHRLVCTSANDISPTVSKAHSKKLGFLTSSVFSKIGSKEFGLFRELEAGRISTPTPFNPKKHQSVAIKKCENHFGNPTNTRGKVIHPCGSGKTLTGYWVSQALNAKTILITVPSLALIRQTLDVWTREASANKLNMDWMAVCSDEGVSRSDDPAMHTVDLGISVDTNPDNIAKFLSNKTSERKLLITTYQSGRAVSQAAKNADVVFDLGIYDEAHKTVGRRDKKFAHLVHDENVKISKRLFLTATERVFKGNSDEILSMDDEDVYGALIDHMSFKEAIETKPPILSDYKIVTTIVKKSEIEELIKNNDFVKSDGKDWSIEADASMFASLIALRKLLSEQDIRHIVSFHSSIKRAKEFMVLNTKASKIDSSLSALTAFHVSGKDGTAVRAQTLERFVDAQPSLITNARCLTEGVDIPAIDAVLFADPKQSVIDIVQATGRALRRFDKKDFGYIILPIVIDEHNDASVKEGFAQIINVLSALAINDDRIIDEFKAIVAGQRKQGPIVEINTPYPATIVVPSIDFEQFRSNIEILVWDRLSFAKSVIGESDFTKWMRDTTNLTEASIKHYTNAMRKISNDLVRLKLAYSSLEELMYSEDPKTLKKEYFAIPKYKELNDRGNNMYSVAFDHLINYHQDKYSITQ